MEEKLHEREKTHFKVVVGVFLVIILGFSFYSSTTLFNTQPQATEFTIEDIDFLLQAAKQLYISGDYQGAIDMYAEILLLEPNHKYASRRTAQTYLYWYKYDQAEEWLLKTIDAHPDDASLLTGLGKLYRNMDRHDDAEAAFLKSLELDPQLDTTYSYGLGYLYLKEDRYEEAEAMFKKALELNPTSDFNLMAMGDLYREIDEYQLSEEMFKEAYEDLSANSVSNPNCISQS
jgi:tetratricopeptide (TPR) repeat protein